MTALALSVFTASVLGSLHCAGMCGGLVAVAAGDACGGRRPHQTHACFSVGRLIAYLTLGAIAGSVGALVDLAGHLAGAARTAAVLAGIAVLASGVVMLLDARGVRRPHLPAPRRLTGVLARAVRTLIAPGSSGMLVRNAVRSRTGRAAALGVLAACLPCGWLYAFVLTAAATATPLGGALVMAAFWLGTLPALLLVGAGARAVTGSLRRHVPVACAVAMIVVGLLTVAGRTALSGIPHGAPHAPALEESATRVLRDAAAVDTVHPGVASNPVAGRAGRHANH